VVDAVATTLAITVGDADPATSADACATAVAIGTRTTDVACFVNSARPRSVSRHGSDPYSSTTESALQLSSG
jgi:hypothetical protein